MVKRVNIWEKPVLVSIVVSRFVVAVGMDKIERCGSARHNPCFHVHFYSGGNADRG